MDHRDIGQQLDLFMFHPLAPGCPIWLPNGNTIYSILSEKIRDFNKRHGYVEVRTPLLWKTDLFKRSGHWDHYAENMFKVFGAEGDEFALKPMNCPGHMLIFKSKLYSYRDLPVRIHDQGILHRNEVSGALGGLTRCRSFCQDDGHVFLANDSKSIQSEVSAMIGMINRVYDVFGMPLRMVIATRPDKFMGKAEVWQVAEDALIASMSQAGFAYSVDKGGGAFYGPKIDFIVKDSLGREWQTATIQLDFQLPEKFDLSYVDDDNAKHVPVVIHRAMYGSFERFIGILLEHYQGKLPIWLSPIQVMVLPIAERHVPACEKIVNALQSEGIRVAINSENLTLNKKILRCQEQFIPKMLIIGDKEIYPKVSIRSREGEQINDVSWPIVAADIKDEEVNF